MKELQMPTKHKQKIYKKKEETLQQSATGIAGFEPATHRLTADCSTN